MELRHYDRGINMFHNWSDFQRRHDYLVCVDSDGCAMDTMDCKHIHCFGPCIIQWEQITRIDIGNPTG